MKGLIKKAAAIATAVVMSTSFALAANAQTNSCNHSNKTLVSHTRIVNNTYTHDPHIYGSSQVCTVTNYTDVYVWVCNECGANITTTISGESHSISHS